MSALPRYFRHPPARQSLGRRQPRCRDNGPCSRSWCDRVTAARPGGCRSGDRSRQLLSDAGNGCRNFSGPIQRLLSRLLAGGRIVGLRGSESDCDGWRTENRLVSYRTAPCRHRLPLVCSVSSNFTGCPVFRWRTVARSRANPCGATSSTFKLNLQLCANRPDLLRLERWLGAEQFAFIPRHLARGVTGLFIEGLHGRTPPLRWSASVCSEAGSAS